MDDYSVWERRAEPEEIWRRYFQTLGEAARSGLFDILAHPDLVKVWGRSAPAPEGDLRRYYELAIDGDRAARGSPSRSRRPACESASASCIPAPAFLAMCVEAGAPVALSSDAHRPEDVGADYGQALELLERSACASCACSSGARAASSRSAPDALAQERPAGRQGAPMTPASGSAMTPIASPPGDGW